MMKYNYDCKYYLGDKPCRFGALCPGCGNYRRLNKRILIIKLAAMGDALRTTTILPALKEKFPDCSITWVTDARSYEILKFAPLIDRLMVLDLSCWLRLAVEEFDMLFSFDKAPEAISLATLCNSKVKKGFSMARAGALSIFNKESEYALRLGMDDGLKFKTNKKTYQQIIFEMAGFTYAGQEYALHAPVVEGFRDSFLARHSLKKEDILIGVFPGCGQVFPTKKWGVAGFTELIDLLGAQNNKFKIILLGGPEEREINKEVKSHVKAEIIDAGCDNTLADFIQIIKMLSVIVAGDTLAFHLAIAARRRTVGLFTSTSASEIELYGRGEIIKAALDCSPCYKSKCESMECRETIKPQEVMEAVLEQAPFAK